MRCLLAMHHGSQRWGAFALLVVLGAAPACGGTATKPPVHSKAAEEAAPSKPGLPAHQRARQAYREGRWGDAERLLEEVGGQEKQSALLLLAEIRILTGRPEDALRTLGDLNSVAAAVLRARALRSVGKVDEALVSVADRPDADPEQRQVLALHRGSLLIEIGKRQEARDPLLFAIEQVSRPGANIKEHAGEMWSVAGRAAHLLREAELANEAFDRAEIAGNDSRDLLLARFNLYLEKHDAAHAEEVLSEIAKRQGHHPDVLYAEARLHLEAALDFAAAEEIAERLLSINPESSDARFLLAGIALRTMDFELAERHVQAALAFNPRDLRALSMRAAVQFLAEDPEGFERTVNRVLELSPRYAQIFYLVSEYAEWEHRYPDIERLLRRAARLDSEDASVRTLLGLTLVRSGSDAAGLVELDRAYDLDPFNVRVLNTLNLYEKIIPSDYLEFREGPFEYRFPKGEAELLKRYVPDLLETAHREMVKRYDYSPQAPIGIEIYRTPDQFAVRTSGLPQTAIAGVCFGRKLATVSPAGSPGNLGMTLWHELGHVFHIGLSNYRVPRWLTEGLAEWETARREVGWSRELDRELFQTLAADALPPLDHMNRAFTHARHHQDVASAYYASGLIAEWMVESRGERAPVGVLRELGEKRLAKDVVPEVLGSEWATLDTEFRSWLNGRLARFEHQFLPRLVRTPLQELEPQLEKNPKDRALRVQVGQALLAEGQVDRAHRILTDLHREAYQPDAAYLLARIALSKKKMSTAVEFLSQMVQKGDDGYEVRIVMARALLAEKKETEARTQLEKARGFDPKAEEPLGLLAALYRKAEDTDGELAVLRTWAGLAEHDGFVHRRFLELLLEKEQFEEASRVAQWAIWADLADMDLHRLAGRVFSKVGDWKRAEYEWESALLCPGTPRQLLALGSTWTAELEAHGRGHLAEEVKERILGAVQDLDPSTSPENL